MFPPKAAVQHNSFTPGAGPGLGNGPRPDAFAKKKKKYNMAPPSLNGLRAAAVAPPQNPMISGMSGPPNG